MTEGKKRKLIIKDCKIDDTANITIKVPGDESSAPLKVARKSTTKIWIIMLQNPSHGIIPSLQNLLFPFSKQYVSFAQ